MTSMLLLRAVAAQGELPRPTAQAPQMLLESGDFGDDWQTVWGLTGRERLTAKLVDADVGGCARAMHLEAQPDENQPAWQLGFGAVVPASLRQGDQVYVRAWLRSPERCRVTFIYELAVPPHTKDLSQQVRLTPEWQEYRFVAHIGRNYTERGSQFKWFLGHDAGTVELAAVRVENYGLAEGMTFAETIDWWGGREHPDTWRQAALDRIELLRKGELTVHVVDAAGNPVNGAEVHVEQQRHHFRFGTALPAGRLADTTNPDNVRFQAEVARLFNTVTFENDLKWAAGSEQRLETVDRAVEWLAARGFNIRGHCLVWGSYQHLGADARELRGQPLRGAIRQHVLDYAQRMSGRLYLWDVVNEAATNTEVWQEVGWDSFPASFRWAREGDPEVRLCYNDYGIVNENPPHRRQVAERVKALLDAGVPLDVLGIQGHMGVPLTPVDRVLAIFDEWAAFGKPLEITEFDLGCRDDAVHATYVRDFLTAAFSHPAVEAFIQWGFWEGSHWRAKDGAAMFRRDWSKRPAEEAYEDLVLDQWWTRWDGTTGDAGNASLRAFHGRQQVTVAAAGKQATAVIELVPGEAGRVEVRLP